MKRCVVFLLLICVMCGVLGCAAEQSHMPAEHTADVVRTFAPDAADATPTPEKRGILKSLLSPSGHRTAYIYTMNAVADPVVYELKIADTNEGFSYEQGTVLYSSSFSFDMEWGDETSLMVSLNEKDISEPTPVTEDGVMVMFGRRAAAQS